MATTTPNFGWAVPTSTDLVKDGAVAIETLGDSIDASLVDLKGGTTGQVLAKASNTDMDFVWSAQDDSNAIQNAIVDAKGDLIAATANDTPARLAVGSNNYFLRANSSESTGLEWAGNWVTYTPTFTNFTLGNGTVNAKFMRVGNTVFAKVQVVLGTTSVMSLFPLVSAPTNIASNQVIIGQAFYLDTGVATYIGSTVTNGNNLQPNTIGTAASLATDSSVSATAPFTWGATDSFTINVTYEAA